MKKLSLAILVAFLTQVAFAENLKWEDADCRFEKITSKSQTDIELETLKTMWIGAECLLSSS